MEIMRSVLETIIFMHENVPFESGRCVPVLHRNLRASGFVYNQEGQLRIGDLRNAKRLSPAREQTTEHIHGSPAWMAPEMVQVKPPYRLQDDTWSIGIHHFTLLTGTFPFHGRTSEDVKNEGRPHRRCCRAGLRRP